MDLSFSEALSAMYGPIEVMGVIIDPIVALKALEPAYYAELEAEWGRQGNSPTLTLVT